MRHKKLIGATLAATAALTFATAPMVSALADGTDGKVKCFGANACKGKGSCKTSQSGCKGQNGCKGKGAMMMDSEKACTDAGGGTTEPK